MQWVRVKTRVEILLTKLRTDLSKNILKINLFSILKTSAMMTQFVPRYMVFFLPYHMRWFTWKSHYRICGGTSCIRGFKNLSSGRNLYLYWKSSIYAFQRKSYNMYKCCPLVKPMMVVASDWYIIDIIVYYLTDGITMIPLFLINICAKKNVYLNSPRNMI